MESQHCIDDYVCIVSDYFILFIGINWLNVFYYVTNLEVNYVLKAYYGFT